MKLYTRTGDDGSTGLNGGKRVPKNDPHVEAYGTCDELSAALGLARVACQSGTDDLAIEVIEYAQRVLFEIGADLATPADASAKSRIGAATPIDIDRAEKWIDQACLNLPEQKHFILAGGCELAARLHLARTVARRVERMIVGVRVDTRAYTDNLIFLNRLSDLLFALARLANHSRAIEDVPWFPRETKK
jgi:cob(I)alamin adenosyltransferase